MSRLGALLVAAVPLFTACRQAGPGPGGAERFVVSDDGAAVLWIPEGATSADDITVTRVASDTMVVYELLPDGLKLAVPAVLFVRAPGAVPAEDGEGPARVAMLAGDVVSSDGSVEAVQTVRGAITGSEGPQHGLIALVVPHFTKARMQIPSVIVEGSLHDNGASHFRRTVGETWDASVVLTFPVVGSAARPPSIDYTVQTSGSVALTDATAAGPRPFPIGPGVVPSASLRLKCNSAGPGFVRVVVTSGSSSMVLHLAGICAAPEFAAALEGTADVFLSSDEAVAALVEDVMGPLPAPKPTAPVQPVRELAWGNPGPPTHTQELTLSCTECPLNVPQMGRYRVTATSAAKPEQLHLRVSGGGVVSIAKPSAQWSALPTGQTADLAFTYTCTAAGTGRIEPRLTHTPPLPAPVDPHAFVALSGPVSVSPYKGADGNSFALITCGSPGKDVRVGLSDRVPIGRFSTGNWELDAAAAFADVCDPNTPPYPLTGDTVAIKVTKCGYVTRTRTVVLKSNRQNVTGTWDPNQNVYDFGGAAPGPAYDPTDSLQASFVLEDGGTPVTNVSAPAGITNPNLFFSAPSGWGTRVRFADGYANTLQTRALFTSTTGPAGATYEVTRLTPASALPLVGSFRETPLFAPEVTQQLAATGWTLTTVDVQLANSVNAAWVTPPEQPVAVRAGRTFRFDVTSLFADAGTGGGAGGGAGGGGGGGGTSGTGGGGGSGGSGGAGGGSSTFVQLTPAAGPASAELAARLGENHAGFVQQRLTGSAQVVSGNVLLYDNPTGGASRIVGVLATFAAGTAVGAFSNSNQPVNMTTGGPYVKGGERWAMVTRVNAGRRLTLDRLSGTGPLTATAIEVVVLGDYNPEYTVTETAPMTLFENYGPITTYFSTLVMTMSPGGGEPAMRWKICPDGLPCAMPGEVRRITLPATMGNPVPVNNTFVTWPHDIAGNVSPLTATFSIYIEVPPTGPYRIIWNRL